MWETAINSLPVKHVFDGRNAMRENVTKKTGKTYIKFMRRFGQMLGLVDERHAPDQPSLASRVSCP